MTQPSLPADRQLSFPANRQPSLSTARRRRAGWSRRRMLGAVMAGAVVASASACGVRIGRGAPSTLPTASPEEARRDGLARQAMLVASTASVLAQADSTNSVLYEELKAQAEEQLRALGGVWQPWPSDAPTDLPTTTPLPSAATDASVADLLTLLAEATTAARQAAIESVPGVESSGGTGAASGATNPADSSSPAVLYASLAAAWSVAAARLAEVSGVENTAATEAAREGSTLESPLPAALLETYDGARFALETIAARTSEPERSRASSQAEAIEGVVLASLALDGTDSRLAAYAWPSTAQEGASLEQTWARESWERIVAQELTLFGASAQGSADGSTSLSSLEQCVDAAINAAHALHAWGGSIPPLPGLSLSEN